MNVNKKLLETEFLIAKLKTLFLVIFDPRSSIVTRVLDCRLSSVTLVQWLQLLLILKIWKMWLCCCLNFIAPIVWELLCQEYLHFDSKPLMNLYNFATVHSLMNDTKFDWQLPSSLLCAICFEHQIHSPDVTLVLWLAVSHTWVACAKLLHWLSVFTLAVPLFRFAF